MNLTVKLEELEKIIEVLKKYNEFEDIVVKLEMTIIKERIF
ncbi:unnamed protein product [marine sediment metagenome]|uniref:Uncharacterized protein n=1 Tax=marine sediment metagenome TaxID=412755 RepID=X1I7V7_9ZZZZ